MRTLAFAGLLVAALVVGAGCTGDAGTDRAVIRTDGRLEVVVDADGWRVAPSGGRALRVREAIAVQTAGRTVVVVWRNGDRYRHEIMLGAGRDAVTFAVEPGQTVERHLAVGFDARFHSHHAPHLPEIRLTVGPPAP